MRKTLGVATGVSLALLLLASVAMVVSPWYGLRRFGGEEYVPRVVGLQITRELAAAHALLVVALHETAFLHASSAPPRRRDAVLASIAVPLFYPIVAAIEGLSATAVARMFGMTASIFEMATPSDVGRGLVIALALAPFAGAWMLFAPRVFRALNRGLRWKLFVTWLAVLAVSCVGETIARVAFGRPSS